MVRLVRWLKSQARSYLRRRQLQETGADGALTAFWWGQGRQWAEHEASPEDLTEIGALAARIAQSSEPQADTTVVSELKTIWRRGQPDALDAFGWDEMNDQLPASALTAFVRGAGSIQQAKS